jgi:hypothetical protein
MSVSMRWQALFADLEGQARALQVAERDSEVADRTRAELGQVSLLARLYRRVGRPVQLNVEGPGEVSGRLERIGADWLLVTTPDETVVSLAAITLARNLPVESTAQQGISEVRSRMRLTSVLRAVARDRSSVVVAMRAGLSVWGTPERVGADWFDLAVHDAGLSPRRQAVQSRVTIPFSAVATVRRGMSGWD